MPDPLTAALTGVWHGRFSYPHDLPPGDFVAVLFQTGERISGTTHEVDFEGGSTDGLLYATLEGRRQGARVDFDKTYDGAGGRGHTVRYTGLVSPDATEIAGEWSIPGVWSGKFLMVRPAPKGQALERETATTA